MNSNLFDNPHSQSPSSVLSTNRVESVRLQMLQFFNADPEHFDLIFVANTTAAIKLVVDCLVDYSRDHRGLFWYGYHADSHTSLVAPREVAGATSQYFASDQQVEDWLSPKTIRPGNETGCRVGLFAYPAQSNMNGRRLPLTWPGRLRSSVSPDHHGVYSLLDAAALVATAPLDLSDWKNAPDFTALSFYKIFGFPDLGALIVRKEAGHVLGCRRYFGGGTVDMVINSTEVSASWYARKETSLHEKLEDGTPAFHSIIALESAVKVHRKTFGSMANVSQHTCRLANILHDDMSSLIHGNRKPLCIIYRGVNSVYGQSRTQGPTIAFNVRDSSGGWIGKSDFDRLAIINNIQLRTGGVCNPGGIALSLGFSPQEMHENYAEGLRCGNDLDELNGKPTGIIRVSLGAMSNMKDVRILMNFLQIFVDPSPKGDSEKQSPVSESPLKSFSGPIKACIMSKEDTGSPPLTCPVANCTALVADKVALLDHFTDHRNVVRISRSAALAKRKRSKWRIFSCGS